jgi:tetratricopeptide (TPR) repeat protein
MGLADYQRALEAFEAGLAIAEATDLHWHLGPSLVGSDLVRGCTGQYAAAWKGLNASIQRLKSLGLTRYQIMSYDHLGYLLCDLGLYREAADLIEQGLNMAREAKVMYWEPLLRANLAIAQFRLGTSSAKTELEQALDIATRNRQGYLATRCLEGLAELSLAHGAFDACAGYASQLLDLASRGKLREFVAQAHRLIGAALLAGEELDRAQQHLNTALSLSEPIGRVRLSLEVHGLLALLHRKRGDAEMIVRHEGAAADIAKRIEQDLSDSGLSPKLNLAQL